MTRKSEEPVLTPCAGDSCTLRLTREQVDALMLELGTRKGDISKGPKRALFLIYKALHAQAVEEKKAREAEERRRAALKHYRVRWTEEYEKVFEAPSEEAAIENRDDDDAFRGCAEVTAQEVERCYKAAPSGRKECSGCDDCESGWRAVTA